MPKVMICGKGGSGKSTLVTMLSKSLGERHKVLVVDTDESNTGLAAMLDLPEPEQTVMEYLGGKESVRQMLGPKDKEYDDSFQSVLAKEFHHYHVPGVCSSRNGQIHLICIGKIEHTYEGCACHMGLLARTLLKELPSAHGEWIFIDTEAGIEHFGRGLIEGVDVIIALVDPSRDSINLAKKIQTMVHEAEKPFGVVLSKVDAMSESVLRETLTGENVTIVGTMKYSREILEANLFGKETPVNGSHDELRELIAALSSYAELLH